MKSKVFFGGLSLVSGILLMGCGDDSGASYTATCLNYHSNGNIVCVDYYGSTTAQVQSACNQSSPAATYQTTACTTSGRIANCNSSNLTPTAYTVTSYYSPTTTTQAQNDCDTVSVNGKNPTFSTN